MSNIKTFLVCLPVVTRKSNMAGTSRHTSNFSQRRVEIRPNLIPLSREEAAHFAHYERMILEHHNNRQRNVARDTNTESDTDIYESTLFKQIILPLENLKRNMPIMSTTEIIISFKHSIELCFIDNLRCQYAGIYYIIRNDLNVAVRWYKMINDILGYIYDTRYGELIKVHDSNEIFIINLQSTLLSQILICLQSYYYECKSKDLSFVLLKPHKFMAKKILQTLICRYCAFSTEKDICGKTIIYDNMKPLCHLYRKWSGMAISPLNKWDLLSKNGDQLTKSAYILEALRDCNEEVCSVCLFANISEDMDFGILDCCKHLFCVPCLEKYFYDPLNNKRYVTLYLL